MDMYGDVSKVVFIANDITKEKQMEFETAVQNEQLKIQEEKLRLAGEELTKKLGEAKEEMKLQFKEIEKIKVRTELTLEGALDAIITINEVGSIEFFNQAAQDLWGIERKEAIGKNVKVLFSKEAIKNDEFVKKYVTPGSEKIVGVRKEVNIKNINGEEKPVLFLLSEAKVGDDHTYTAFIQNIEVELF
jgi:PAS domain S-box-containing protein